MDHVETLLIGLLVAVVVLSTVARWLSIPYPILLVIGGLALGLVPGVPEVELEPELVLVIFLPPLLYSAAFFSDLRGLRRDLRSISTLAIGLVLATTLGVGVVVHEVVPGIPWAAAFALGAVVSPTDPIAATAIMHRVGAPRRLVNIVEGESLVNDATALVAYRVAVAAAVTGSFSVWEAGLRFLAGGLGGVAIGLAVGWAISEIRRRIDDIPVELTISLLTGYAAYVPAEELGASGVLAAVAAGIVLGWRAPRISTAEMRLQGYSVWQILVFLLNATLFLLIGLQLPTVLDGLEERSTGELLGYAVLVSAVVIGLRIVYVNLWTAFIRAVDRRESQRARRAPARVRLIGAWAGMRGAVSLAAALAIPLETDAGTPFPERDLIIFLAFAVILATLVLQGLTLPMVIRWAHVRDDDEEEREEVYARLVAADAAIARIDELAAEPWTRDDTADRMRALYAYRRRRFAARKGIEEDDGFEERADTYQRMVHDVIAAQRAALLGLRDRGEISSEVMRHVERDLDLEETRLEI